MRVSDADRERVVTFLRAQSLEGRIDADELDERSGAAYAAKTVGDLEALVEDLPHRRVPVATRPPAPRRNPLPAIAIAGGAGLLALIAAPSVLAVVLGIVFVLGVTAVATTAAIAFVFAPFILLGLLIAHLVRRRQKPPRQWSPRTFS